MSVAVKICGLTQAADIDAVNAAGAHFAGFVFFEKSPRHIEPVTAQNMAHMLADTIKSVALLVDPTDMECTQLLDNFKPDYLQLHGHETPERVHAIKQLTGLPIIKACGIHNAADLDHAQSFETVADILLFDAKPPQNNKQNNNPSDTPQLGGRGVSFDWSILAAYHSTLPWMLAGGLTDENVAQAVKQTGAVMVDVSSGVESTSGHKDRDKILNFICAAQENA